MIPCKIPYGASIIHRESASQVKPPRIDESAVQMECILRDTYDVRNK